uniref:Uncharacterized protein n=1 Tax=Bactrocera dorsalis TaxID=27457 RepID=A0A034WV59_BACDO
MEMLIELITLIVLVIIVLIIICFICMVIRRSSGEQNLVHPDELEMRPFQQAPNQLIPNQPAEQPRNGLNGLALLVMSVNEVISRAQPQMNVRLGGRVEFAESAV